MKTFNDKTGLAFLRQIKKDNPKASRASLKIEEGAGKREVNRVNTLRAAAEACGRVKTATTPTGATYEYADLSALPAAVRGRPKGLTFANGLPRYKYSKAPGRPRKDGTPNAAAKRMEANEARKMKRASKKGKGSATDAPVTDNPAPVAPVNVDALTDTGTPTDNPIPVVNE